MVLPGLLHREAVALAELGGVGVGGIDLHHLVRHAEAVEHPDDLLLDLGAVVARAARARASSLMRESRIRIRAARQAAAAVYPPSDRLRSYVRARRLPSRRARVVRAAVPRWARPSRRRAGWPAIAAGRGHADRRAHRLGQDARRLPRLHRPLAARARGRRAPARRPTEVVYVSPLKALAADIQQNLEAPLAEIRATARGDGARRARAPRRCCAPATRRPSARAAMVKRPPHLLITTPESLYLLLTAAKSRERLRTRARR